MDPDPGTTLDPTPFFSDFKDAKKLFFPYFFLTVLNNFFAEILLEKGRIRIRTSD
jgi:hypothetical protein